MRRRLRIAVSFECGSVSGELRFDGANYEFKADTSAVLTNITPADMVVSCELTGSLFHTGLSQLFIYDCYLDATYADGTTARLRPTVASVITAPDFPDGSVDLPGNAINADSDPPTTCATVNPDTYKRICRRAHSSAFELRVIRIGDSNFTMASFVQSAAVVRLLKVNGRALRKENHQ
jgi:hypothetical protein